MRPRNVLVILLLLWAGLLAWQTRRAVHRVKASIVLHHVEGATFQSTRQGTRNTAILERNLHLLEGARELEPGLVGIPVARGSQYLLLNRPHAAIRAYEKALELEPRPETYLNLGRAQLAIGDSDSALESFRKAMTAAPNLAKDVPRSFREEIRPRRPWK